MKADAVAAYIPMPKGRGFTPQLIKAGASAPAFPCVIRA